jgi:GTP cyclohydrolase IA
VVIDDLIDSGRTSQRYTKPFYALFNKQREEGLGWLTFPWEVTEGGDTSGEDIVVRLLQYIGEDPEREGLKDTPQRVLKAWKEWAVGYDMDPGQVLKTFEDGADGVDEMVVVHNIPVISKCEHHLADITGIAHVGYIPNGRIVGLSKLARLVDVFARRLQVQERMTNQIAESLHEHLNPIGIGVVIRASHACMSTRGVKVHGSTTTTSAMRGALRNDQSARAEFLSLCRAAEG